MIFNFFKNMQNLTVAEQKLNAIRLIEDSDNDTFRSVYKILLAFQEQKPQPLTVEKLYTLSELSDILHVKSSSSAKRWVNNNNIPIVYAGSKIMKVRESDVRRVIQQEPALCQ